MRRLIILLTLLGWMALPGSSTAQVGTHLQAGPALTPSAGVQVGIVPQRTLYSIEAMGQASYRPPFLGGEHNWYISAGFGGALRVMGIVDFVLDRTSPHQVDIGLRLGPGLQFKPDETIAERNRRFFLSMEPFARYTFRMQSGRTLFAELGAQQPFIRVGLWFPL